MARKPFTAGNWKMNASAVETQKLISALKPLVSGLAVDVAVAPPFVYLPAAKAALQGSSILLGAQNASWEDKGAFTGEVAPVMLKDVGCDFVILGHSERRQIFGETDAVIAKKIRKTLDTGLSVIACIGETLDERETGKTESVIKTQLAGCLGNLSTADMTKITLAYEPVWAIGTGRTATPEQAQDVHKFIRNWLNGKFGADTAGSVRIQYGGSVKADNAKSLLSQPDIDGALVGGASLEAAGFAAIVKAGV
jgi:triosephosphate isomerase